MASRIESVCELRSFLLLAFTVAEVTDPDRDAAEDDAFGVCLGASALDLALDLLATVAAS